MRFLRTLVMCGALGACAAPAGAQAPAAKLPRSVAVLPFGKVSNLEQALVDQLVADSTFEVVVDRQTSALYLEPPQFRRAFDALAARAAGGHAPDSATAALLMKRLHVDGFLYAYSTLDGPVVEVWSSRTPSAVVFHYASQEEVSGGDVLPEASRGGAANRGSVPMTGGGQSSQSSSGGPSKSSGKSTEPASELKTGMENTRQVDIRGALDDKDRRTVSTVAEKLKRQRREELKVAAG